MFAEVRAAVAAGRLRPVGGWYIQPEGNTGSGEAFARLGLYGQKFFLSRFGLKCGGSYLPDTFGHHANFPAILLGAELRYHVFNRPPNWGLPLPQALFRWRGANGASVPAYRIAGYSYGGFTAGTTHDAAGIARHIDSCLATLSDAMPAGMLFYGVGNHGGGPTRRVLDELETAGRAHAAARGFELVYSDPDAYFAELAQGDGLDAGDPLPEHRGSINKISIGVYTNWNRVKRALRHAEAALFESEALAAAAGLDEGHADGFTGGEGSAAAHERLWKQVLFVLFYDMVTGTSIRAVEDDALRRLAGVAAETDGLATLAAARLARRLDTRPPAEAGVGDALGAAEHAQAVVLVQPVPGPYALPVELELMGMPAAFRLLDAEGGELAYQELPPRAHAFNESHGRRRFIVRIPGVRPNAAVLWAVPGRPAASATASMSSGAGGVLRAGETEMHWDPAAGLRALSVGGQPGLDPLDPLAFHLLDDDSDSWGHSKRTLTELVVRYDLWRDRLRHVRTRQSESGPIRQTLESLYEGGPVRVALRLSLLAGLDGLLAEARVNWRGRYAMLKVSCGTALGGPHMARAKIPFCHEEVEIDGREIPVQEWLHLTGRGEGVGLVTDTTYSYSVRGPILDATLLRSTPYAYDFNTPPADDAEAEFTDQGDHVFRFLLVAGAFDPARLDGLSRNLILPPRAVREYTHAPAAGGGRVATWVGCDAAGVGIACLKRTEADDGYAMRVVERAGRAIAATLTLGGRTATVALGPLQFKTVVWRDAGGVEETSFLEGM